MIEEKSKIVDRAINDVAGFEKVFKVIHQNTVLKGQSKSTFHNYLRRIALISLHFDRLPENISDDEMIPNRYQINIFKMFLFHLLCFKKYFHNYGYAKILLFNVKKYNAMRFKEIYILQKQDRECIIQSCPFYRKVLCGIRKKPVFIRLPLLCCLKISVSGDGILP